MRNLEKRHIQERETLSSQLSQFSNINQTRAEVCLCASVSLCDVSLFVVSYLSVVSRSVDLYVSLLLGFYVRLFMLVG